MEQDALLDTMQVARKDNKKIREQLERQKKLEERKVCEADYGACTLIYTNFATLILKELSPKGSKMAKDAQYKRMSTGGESVQLQSCCVCVDKLLIQMIKMTQCGPNVSTICKPYRSETSSFLCFSLLKGYTTITVCYFYLFHREKNGDNSDTTMYNMCSL